MWCFNVSISFQPYLKGISQSLLTIIFFLFIFSVIAQRNVLRIDGITKEEKEKLEGVSISVYRNKQFFAKTVTESNGKFLFQLNYDSDYILEFSKPGYVNKIVSVNTDGVPIEDQDFGHEYGGWDLSLFKKEDGIDISMFEKPYVKIVYNPDLKKFEHDAEYTNLIKEEFEQIKKDLVIKRKEDEKRKKEEEKASEKAAIEIRIKQKAEEEAKRKAESEAKLQKKKEEAATKIAKAKLEQEERKKTKEAEAEVNEEERAKTIVSPSKTEESNKAMRDTVKYKTREEFSQALSKLYPQGITEEIYMEGNVKITRRIVVDGNSGTEYKMSEHPWGGRFWFKNGMPINESIWNAETQEKN